MSYLLRFTFILALLVIILGAWTRLGDAGLSCPDWPTCYGQFVVPEQQPQDYHRPLEKDKAWKELIHRYAAALLGLLIIVICFLSFKIRAFKPLRISSIFLLLIVLAQGLLGALTVTQLVHPGVVVLHLFGGFITACLIFWLILKQKIRVHYQRISKGVSAYLMLVIVLLLVQIFLGGWTSANYAAIACGDFFPSCLGHYSHPINFEQIFYWGELGIDYQYGILNEQNKIAIQLLHRLGALLVIIATLILFYLLNRYRYSVIRSANFAMISLLLLQVLLGIINIVASLPIVIAIMHNIGALLLLLSLLYLAHKTKASTIDARLELYRWQ